MLSPTMAAAAPTTMTQKTSILPVEDATPANRSDVSPGNGSPAVSSRTGTKTAQ